MKAWIPYIKGFVRLRIQSERPERFLRLCAHHRVTIHELSGNDGVFECRTALAALPQLTEICRKTDTRMQIIEKHGLPFFFYRAKKRKAFFVGLLAGLLLLYFLSCRVWNIHIEGNYRNSTPVILAFLEEKNVCHGISKKEVNCARIAAGLRENFSDITWVSVRLIGTRMEITIQENEHRQKTGQKEPPPSDLIADKDGTIVRMITRQGTPLAGVGDICKKGDLLVRGRIDLQNDAQETVKYRYVFADADIYLKRRCIYRDSFPLRYEKRSYTGRTRTRYFLQAFGRRAKVWNPFRRAYKNYDSLCQEYPMYATENFRLPFSFGVLRELEYVKTAAEYTPAQAEARAERKFTAFLEKLLEKGVQICENNVKIECKGTMCISRGTLTVIERTGVSAAIASTPQPAERNTDSDEQ